MAIRLESESAAQPTKQKTVDVLVVGAGPAGIALGLNVSMLKPSARVMVVETGRKLDRRPCPVDKGRACRGCGGICNVISGVGGSIHYGDGLKLSLLPSGRRLVDLFGADADDLCLRAYRLFDSHRETAGTTDQPNKDAEDAKRVFDKYGVSPRDYPVEVIGESRLKNILQDLNQQLSEKTTLMAGCEVVDVHRRDSGFELRLVAGRPGRRKIVDVHTAFVIFATGRSGLTSTQRMMEKLGVDMLHPNYSKGIRLEMPQPYLQAVGTYYPDFKFSNRTALHKIKTFCFCGGPNGGRIKFTNYQRQFDHELITLDGHETLERTEDGGPLAANFGLLCQQKKTEQPVASSRGFFDDVLAPYLKLSGCRPVVQTMKDFRARRPSAGDWSQLSAQLPFQPSVADLIVAPVHELFSFEEHKSLVSTFDQLIFPITETAGLGLSKEALDRSVLVIALELEFMWSTIQVDANCETTCPGVFVAGDAAGLAQGVIQAAMMGIRVGDELSRRLDR